MDIGLTTGVLVTGLLLGHLGFSSSSAASTYGKVYFNGSGVDVVYD